MMATTRMPTYHSAGWIALRRILSQNPTFALMASLAKTLFFPPWCLPKLFPNLVWRLSIKFFRIL